MGVVWEPYATLPTDKLPSRAMPLRLATPPTQKRKLRRTLDEALFGPQLQLAAVWLGVVLGLMSSSFEVEAAVSTVALSCNRLCQHPGPLAAKTLKVG